MHLFLINRRMEPLGMNCCDYYSYYKFLSLDGGARATLLLSKARVFRFTIFQNKSFYPKFRVLSFFMLKVASLIHHPERFLDASAQGAPWPDEV